MLAALAVVVITAAQWFGFDLDAGKVTEVLMALGVLISAATAYYQRTTLVKAADGFGDVDVFGQAVRG